MDFVTEKLSFAEWDLIRIFENQYLFNYMKYSHMISVCLIALLLACSGKNEITPPAPIEKQAVVDTTAQVTTPQGPDEPGGNGGTGDTGVVIPEDAILVTNAYMEKYLEEVHYPEGDWSYSKILEYPGGGANGVGDVPPTVTISWQPATTGTCKLTLTEGDWNREFSLKEGATSLDVTNLVPCRKYEWVVSDSDGSMVASDSFWTKGHLHQVFFTKQARNARDLGGWKTADGKTVKFRKVFRGGKMSENYIDAAGIKDALAEGIRADLDLREEGGMPSQSPLGKDIAFCGPGFLHGYQAMMEEPAKVKAAFEFVVNCLREDKPVYFHCAIGSDRTGTFSILLLGILGVPEPDICKEYEITYFAPEKWSVTNGKVDRLRTNKSRYLQAIKYLLTYGSYKDFKACVQSYLLKAGVSEKDINDFRTLMLE